MDILAAVVKLRDDLKTWVTNNLNALNTKIDEKTIPIDSKLDDTSTNPVQNRAISKEIDSINDRVGDTPVATQISQAINAQEHFSGDYNDLINAPNITEDESGNMVIADESGNIIFKADAEGIHTTAVSLNGEAAASEKYVDEAIANIPTPDVSGQINAHNASEEAHADIRQAIEDAKEELSESIVAEANEWKVVDEAGNIIFSVDASGAHTTELTLNGESAATEQWVENKNYLTEHQDISGKSDVGHKHIIADITDFTGYATEIYVDNKVADLVNSAPEALNTLGELAAALENHEDAYDALLETVGGKATHTDLENLKEELSESITAEAEDWKVVDGNGNIIFSVDNTGAHTISLTLNGESVKDIIDGKVTAEISKKVDKVDGKGLSTNDFTNEYKEKLDGLDLENITFEETDPTVPAWAKEENKPTYTADEVGALSKDTPLFSGDYNDLENAPNISEDDSGDLIISDKDGNIIFRSNGSGFETVNLTVQNIIINGMTIQEMIRTYVDEAILGGAW